MDVKATLKQIGNAAKAAAAELGFATAERKHAALIGAAEYVWAARGDIIEANALDMDYGREKGLSAAMLDRLMLILLRIWHLYRAKQDFRIQRIDRTVSNLILKMMKKIKN